VDRRGDAYGQSISIWTANYGHNNNVVVHFGRDQSKYLMDTLSQSDIIAIYGAFAGVAAITTALQAAVALQPLSQSDDVNRRKRTNPPGTAEYNDARADAGTYWRGAWLLNVGGAAVNFAVLASWGYLVFGVIQQSRWFLWLPFIAVSIAAAYLVIVAAVGIGRLSGERS
jgi:hypothetical protein